jgi:Tol biopolymer transport system component
VDEDPSASVAVGQGRGDIPFSVSANGVLVRKNAFAPDYQLVWFDRQGRSLGTVGAPTRLAGDPFAPRISPDGTRVAIQNRVTGADRVGLWVIDLQRDLPTRVSSFAGQYPQWSADGRQLAWLQRVDGVVGIYRLSATGLGAPELLVKVGAEAGATTFPNDWSRDGRFILYHTRGEKTRIDVWALPLFGDRKPHPVLQTELDDGPAQLSPDGRWLAYRSDATGTYEIYVQSFTAEGQAGSERVRISTNGGSQPRFRPDGQELFYLADDGRLMAVAIDGHGATFEHGEPKGLFKTRTVPRIVEVPFEYDVARDGQRFLMGTILDGPHATPPPPTIVLNWQAELKR